MPVANHNIQEPKATIVSPRSDISRDNISNNSSDCCTSVATIKDKKSYPNEDSVCPKTASGTRFQGFCVMMHCTSMLLFSAIYFFLWCIPILWPFMIYYTIFHFLFDKSPVNGGVFEKRIDSLRRFGFWKYLTDYFPIRFHKMADLKPTFELNNEKKIIDQVGPNYIFGYHPHGVIATGVSTGLTNNGAGWDEMFPGIRCFVTTLVNQFRIPFYRDYLMALGVTTVVKKNLKLLLGKGASVVIVVGGARESLLAKPGLNSIVLGKRKGFIKLALESIGPHGICVVPVYGFGENNVYNIFLTEDDSGFSAEEKEGEFEFQKQINLFNFNKIIFLFKKIVFKLQILIKDNLGWTVPIVISRGIFNYDFGFVPYPKPINVVFGKPIQITRMFGKKIGDPVSQEEIDFWHAKYIDGLREVWKWGHPQFSYPGDADFKIVE